MALAGLWLADAEFGASLALVVMAWGNLIQHAREARLLAAWERLLHSDEVLLAGEGGGNAPPLAISLVSQSTFELK